MLDRNVVWWKNFLEIVGLVIERIYYIINVIIYVRDKFFIVCFMFLVVDELL